MKLLVSLAFVLIYVFSLLFCDIYSVFSVFTRQPYSMLKFASLPLANTYYISILHVYRHMRMCLYVCLLCMIHMCPAQLRCLVADVLKGRLQVLFRVWGSSRVCQEHAVEPCHSEKDQHERHAVHDLECEKVTQKPLHAAFSVDLLVRDRK